MKDTWVVLLVIILILSSTLTVTSVSKENVSRTIQTLCFGLTGVENNEIWLQNFSIEGGINDYLIPINATWSEEIDWVNIFVAYNKSLITVNDVTLEGSVNETPYHFFTQSKPAGIRIHIIYSDAKGTPGRGLSAGSGLLCTMNISVFESAPSISTDLNFGFYTRYNSTQNQFIYPTRHNGTIHILKATPAEIRTLNQEKYSVLPGGNNTFSVELRDNFGLNDVYLSVNTDGNWTNLDGKYWWYTDWKYVKQVIIHHEYIKEDLVNFPLLIHLTSPDLDHAQPDGDDIIFIDETNSIQYIHEVEYFQRVGSKGSKLRAWVNIPFVSSSEDTVLNMYYGNPYCENQENATGVWSDEYLMVHHLAGDSREDLVDSTGNGWDVDEGNAQYQGTNTYFNRAYNQYLGISDFQLSENTSYTLSMYLKPTAGLPVFSGNGSSNPALEYWSDSFTAVITYKSNNTESIKSWSYRRNYYYHIAMRINTIQNTFSFFGNGELKGQVNLSDIVASVDAGLLLGTNANKSQFFLGIIDELFVFNHAVSDARVETEHYNLRTDWAQVKLVTFGNEQQNDLLSGRNYGSPIEFPSETTSTWVNFTWRNPEVPIGTFVQWKVTVTDLSGNSNESQTETFVINNPPNTPYDPIPQDGENNITNSTILTWSGSDPDPDNFCKYDVYFGESNPPPIITHNQSSKKYIPDALQKNTRYYWKIISWDNHNVSSTGPIWEFITISDPEPDLETFGHLTWTEVLPGMTMTGRFQVQNIGDPDSTLDWTITKWPAWGDWTFTPENGQNLTPEEGLRTIEATVTAPTEKNTTFIGVIIVNNSHNENDFEIIPVSLSTPNKIYSFLVRILQFLMNKFPILTLILTSFIKNIGSD